MNNVLELKGKRFGQSKRDGTGGGARINSKVTVTVALLDKLQAQIEHIKRFWQTEERAFTGVLLSVHYNKIVAKTNRISELFKNNKPNLAVVGAKFNENKDKHIITYFLTMEDLAECSQRLLTARDCLSSHYFSGEIDKATFDNDAIMRAVPYQDFGLSSRSKFKGIIADVSYIDDFSVESDSQQVQQSIITLYDTNTDTKQLLATLGIHVLDSRLLDNQTVFLDKNQLKILLEKAPYLVSMATEDLAELSPEDFIQSQQHSPMQIPAPTIEPTIGVIDTLFDTGVYFSEWVEYHDRVDSNLPKTPNDYRHGTAVTSLIVDGHRLNPWLDDGCGRFRVRHFGVAVGAKFSSFTIAKQIRAIVAENPDITVWNISLGSNQEINDNFISAESAVLDQIQYENNVIFVVAGTNKPNDNVVKIGSPADSINSMVVNAVTKNGLSTRYTRKGLALSFFAKPDVSYYGGSEEQYITVCEPLGEAKVAGTSYASPWIARKLSYLIDVLGLNREVAKALIIDSARGWTDAPTPESVAIYGHGTVPIKIKDIVQSKDDEIKFIVTDVSEKWKTYNYNFPVPLVSDKYPYVAKATMCYFPKCNRAQGVDYTNTELDLHVGRIKDDNKLNDIKDNKQNQDNVVFPQDYLLEGNARDKFRKWDNVKCVVEKFTDNTQPRKSYENKNWGIEINTSNRLDANDGIGLRFAVIVTLKEIKGINRIDEFIRNCALNGWIVNELDVQTRIDINQKVNEEIVFE